MAGKFEIYKDKAGEYRFRLKSSNGQNILASEGYKAKASCQQGIDSVKKNAPLDERFEKLDTQDGKFRFNLRAANHQVIGVSQSYTTKSARDAGIKSVQNNAKDALTVEV